MARRFTLQEMRDLTPTEKAVLADGFSSGFDNPEAARFRWAKIPKISTDAAGSFEYCGMINVKNAHGGYDGWQPFLATITTARGAITGGTIAAINAGIRGFHQRVHHVSVASIDVEGDAAEIALGQPVGQLFPGGAAVGGAIDGAARSAAGG